LSIILRRWRRSCGGLLDAEVVLSSLLLLNAMEGVMIAESPQPKILVTGATGFLGSRIVEQLLETKATLRTTGRRKLPARSLPGYHPADLSELQQVESLVDGVETIIHTAALIHGHGVAKHHDDEFWRLNTNGTESLIRVAAAAGCRRFVHVSSISVYGTARPPYEATTPCQPVSIYAKSKLAAEQIAARIARDTGMQLVILRMAPICGEGARGNVDRLIRAIDRRRFVWVGTGANRKSMVHVDDAASACVAAATVPWTGRVGIYNIAAPACTMQEIVSVIAEGLGRRVPKLRLPAHVPLRVFDGARRIPVFETIARPAYSLLDKWLCDEIYDSADFQAGFNWQPSCEVRETLIRQVRHVRPAHGNCA
jgi:nucleoside-diphosphate-sugar epimerase